MRISFATNRFCDAYTLSSLSFSLILSATSLAYAEESSLPTLNTFGVTGLVDMPSAESQPDAQYSTTVSHFSGITRNTLTFQITPRLSGSFRYSAHQSATVDNYDRSFDLQYRIRDEGKYLPGVAIGMRDIIGTGWYSGEYIVATKTVAPSLKVTGGLGWGRLGSYNSFSNPLSVFGSQFDTRTASTGLGGVPKFSNWFRGPAAFFGGVEWQTPVDRLTLKAEYSSDAYELETGTYTMFVHKSPLNFAADYQFKNGLEVSGYYLYGSEVGVRATISLNPKKPPNAGSIGPAPLPVLARPAGQSNDTSWTEQVGGAAILKSNVNILLSQDGQTLEAFALTPRSVQVRFRNNTHEAPAQAIGRVARALSRLMPASVETFVIVPVVEGIPAVAVTILRSDVEALENHPDGAAEIFRRSKIADAGPLPDGGSLGDGLYPLRSWSLSPYAEASLFDPDSPVRVGVGLRLKGRYEIAPGLVLSGSVKKRLAGNLGTVTRVSNSVMRHVRSDYGLYDNQGDPAIERLTAEYFFRPGENLYGRVTAGYLEKMYGGVSAEILWKPVSSDFGLGVEINYAQQRDFDQLLGFQSFGTVTGHASAYWDMGNGFRSQVDVGRYLAGDWGGTVTVDRVFDNGWNVGAYFTLTDVPFETFGEGSFDKGIRLTVPLAWLSGKPTTKKFSTVIRPVTRDGGARLEVENRLYGLVEDYHGDRLNRRWGRFWR